MSVPKEGDACTKLTNQSEPFDEKDQKETHTVSLYVIVLYFLYSYIDFSILAVVKYHGW